MESSNLEPTLLLPDGTEHPFEMEGVPFEVGEDGRINILTGVQFEENQIGAKKLNRRP